jgi:hypothetical protein
MKHVKMASKIKMRQILIVVALNVQDVEITRRAMMIVIVKVKLATTIRVIVSIQSFWNRNPSNSFM